MTMAMISPSQREVSPAEELWGVGRALGGRARPHPRGQVVAPLAYFFRSVFFIISKNNFRGVSGLLELCRIGL